jgi:hypothetical protein
MTEAEWLASEDPTPMLRLVSQTAGERRLRLFACACCRRIWEIMSDKRSRAVVEGAEAHAEGLISWEELTAVYRPAERAYYDAYHRIARRAQDAYDSTPSLLGARTSAAEAACVCAMRHSGTAAASHRLAACAVAHNWRAQPCPAERKAQAGLLRDVLGDGFVRRTFDPAWRSPDVIELAKAAYECRKEPGGELELARLCVLADALEDARCEAVILAHLRSSGPHVRGCWAVDLALGKG